jgi:DNA-directed RNA polymerase specialized sigma24 family protein
VAADRLAGQFSDHIASACTGWRLYVFDSEAEEVVQESYVRAFTHIEGFKGESSLATWLARIVLNEALGRLCRRRPAIDIDEMAETPDAGSDPPLMPPSRPSSP